MVVSSEAPWQQCLTCRQSFTAKRSYVRHLESDDHRKAVGLPLLRKAVCDACGEGFTRFASVQRHKAQGRCPGLAPPHIVSSTIPTKRWHDEADTSSEQQAARKLFLLEMAAERGQPAGEHPDYGPSNRPVQPSSPTLTDDIHLKKPRQSIHIDSTYQLGSFMDHSDDTNELENLQWTEDIALPFDLMDLDLLATAIPVDAGALETIDEESSSESSASGITASSIGEDSSAGQSSDASSIRSTSSRLSLPRVLRRNRSGEPAEDKRASRIKPTLQDQSQVCLLCKKPYERDVGDLRRHLESHLAQLRSDTPWPTCEVCQVGFAHEHDLRHHQRTVEKGTCCSLPANHEGDCSGYRCGYNFKHKGPCTGHHPPDAAMGDWTEYDRFRLGHLLRKWELAQLHNIIAGTEQARVVSGCFSLNSEPGLRALRRRSMDSLVSSLFSHSSAPHRTDMRRGGRAQIARLEQRLSNLSLDGVSATLRRNAERLVGTQASLDNRLTGAIHDNDLKAADVLICRGARPEAGLHCAVEFGSLPALRLLLDRGAYYNFRDCHESIHRLVRDDRLEIVEMLLSQVVESACRGCSEVLDNCPECRDYHATLHQVLLDGIEQRNASAIGLAFAYGADPHADVSNDRSAIDMMVDSLDPAHPMSARWHVRTVFEMMRRRPCKESSLAWGLNENIIKPFCDRMNK